MSDSLKDQLLKLGFKQSTPPQRRGIHGPQAGRGSGAARADATAPGSGKSGRGPRAAGAHGKAQDGAKGEIDLARAYAIRARKEKDERLAAERQKQEEARQRREARNALTALLDKARLNRDEAEIARHFEYGGKIRRIHVDAEQLRALNAGELAVVQAAGRYHLVSLADAEAAERILPGSLALKIEPGSAAPEPDYADPKYQVPDDLMW